MKSFLIIFFYMLIGPWCSSELAVAPSAKKQMDWTLVRNENSIQIFVKDIPGSNLKELKTLTKFDAGMDALLALLTDINAQPSYVFGCTSVSIIGSQTTFEQNYHFTLYMPWPFTNRDGVLRQNINPSSNSKEIIINTMNMNGLLPINENYYRITSMQSSWHLIKINDNLTLADFRLRLNPGGHVPDWLINLFIDKGPYKTMMNMRTMLKQPKYASAHYNWLHK